jgi:hypothetical protein
MDVETVAVGEQQRRSSRAPLAFRVACVLALCVQRAFAAQAPVVLSNDTAQDDTGAGRAFVEVVAERDVYFVHESIRVVVRAGIERESREAALVQLFQRALDVPVQLQMHWARDHGGALSVELDAAADGPTLALGETIVHARETAPRALDGRTFDVLELEFDVLARVPGELELAPALLRFAYATKFDDDFVRGRVPLDRVDVYVTSLPLALEVRALPDLGRPAEFTGAVGRFTVSADVSPRELAAGDEVQLVLRVAGEGDLGSFTPPRLDRIAGFHLRGVRDERDERGRTLTYDLAVTDARVTQFPALTFPYFDPAPPGRYARAHTEPIALRVSPGEVSSEPGQIAVASRLLYLLIGTAAGVAIGAALAFGIWRRSRARTRAANAPERARARAAASEFRARMDEPGVDAGVALTEYLAAALEATPSAFVGHAAAERLVSAGVPRELAERTAALLDELVGARYGGTAPPAAKQSARALVEELARAFDADAPTR